MSICRPKTVRACVLAIGLTAGMMSASMLSFPGLAQAQTDEESLEFVFVPPVDGAPVERIGAGTRGSTSQGERLKLLVPLGGGLTKTPSPVLYWWIASPYKGKLQFRLNRDGADAPLLDSAEDVSLKAGLNTLNLGDFGVRLQAGDIYRWSLSLAAGDVKAEAATYVEYREVKVASHDSSAKNAKELANAGLWYDAFALVAEEAKLQGARDALLKQVGITLPK